MSGSNSSNPPSVAPAEEQPVGLTVHALPHVGLAEDDRTRRGRWKLLLVLLVCASPVVASYFTYFVIRPEGRTNYATLIQPSRAMPEMALQDLQGQSVPLARLRDQWLLVVAAPAGCNTACEQLLFMQRQLREMMGRERDRLDKVWLITDEAPLRADLQQALEATPAMHLLRAPGPAVAQWLQPEPGQELQAHLYIVDPMGQWMMRTPAQPDPAKVKKDLERLLRASSFWDRAGR